MQRRTFLKLTAASASLAALGTSGCGGGGSGGGPPLTVETQTIAEQAYIFAYPMLETYRTMYIQAVDTFSKQFRVPFNKIYNTNSLIGPDFTDIVRPNNDTIYSSVCLDLRTEPMVISVPAIQARYYSFQLVDMYTFNFAYIGTRATGTGAGTYLIAGPSWHGDKPAGIDAVFRSEGNFVYGIARTEIKDSADLPNVQTIQQQYLVRPLSTFLRQTAPDGPPADVFPNYDKTAAESAAFIEYFNFLLGKLVIDPSEQDLISSFGSIGIGPNRPFDAASLPPATVQAINAGVASALNKIKNHGAELSQLKNGWILTPRIFGNRNQMQGKYLDRAAGAYLGLYGLDLEEAYYPTANWDADGEHLDASKHNYVLRFTKDEIPQVDAFWSITMYKLPEQLLVANEPLERYSIGDRTSGLKRGTDDSLEIYLQAESPGPDKESNWLPAPKHPNGEGPFSITLRMYLPNASELNPLYAPPAIKKQ